MPMVAGLSLRAAARTPRDLRAAPSPCDPMSSSMSFGVPSRKDEPSLGTDSFSETPGLFLRLVFEAGVASTFPVTDGLGELDSGSSRSNPIH